MRGFGPQGTVAWGYYHRFAAARLANRNRGEVAPLRMFRKAHESERYYECATDTTLRRYLCMQVRRRSVLETAAASEELTTGRAAT